MIEENVLIFRNINEIKFTKIYGNTYSVTINSDIAKDGKEFKNIISDIPICNIDSTLELTLSKNYEDFYLSKYNIIRDESYNIPINIRLKSNPITKEIIYVKEGE